MARIARLLSLALVGVALSACTFVGAPPSLTDALGADPDLSDLAAALEAEGLLAGLEGLDDVTIFAPDNDAFTSALSSQQLADTLSYHAVAATARSTDLVDRQTFVTLFANSALGVDLTGGAGLIDGSGNKIEIIETDIEIANGVVHKIGAVLTPPDSIATIASDAGLDTLVAALVREGLATTFADDAQGPFTVFAPSEQAFVDLLTAVNAADFDELDGVLGDLGLTLTEVLQFHVVSGIFGEAAAAAAAGTEVPTLFGAPLTPVATGASILVAQDGGLALDTNGDGVGDANITATNIVASNGVVHLIDAVMVPPSENQAE
jgi:transforming growth factor-beta-induced protein